MSPILALSTRQSNHILVGATAVQSQPLTLLCPVMQLLTNVCIYWFNANITSSMRLYREVAAGGDLKALLGLRVTVSARVMSPACHLCGALQGSC